MLTATATPLDGLRLCRDCVHSRPEPRVDHHLRCMHPAVAARDAWALAGTQEAGSSARDERERTWTLRGRAPCGMRGALWEAKPNVRANLETPDDC
jgi:hypothetical protein